MELATEEDMTKENVEGGKKVTADPFQKAENDLTKIVMDNNWTDHKKWMVPVPY